MRIAILGVGSIGSVILGCLADTDAELIAVSRGEMSDELSNQGFEIHEIQVIRIKFMSDLGN